MTTITDLKDRFRAKLADVANDAAELEALGLLEPNSLDLDPVFSQLPPEGGGAVEYFGPFELSLPRADGAVRVKRWDDFLATLPAGHRVNSRIFTQAALDPFNGLALDNEQRFRIRANADYARFSAALSGSQSWPAYDLREDKTGASLWLGEGTGISDAFALAGDRIRRDGVVTWKAPTLAAQIDALIAATKSTYPGLQPGLGAPRAPSFPGWGG